MRFARLLQDVHLYGYMWALEGESVEVDVDESGVVKLDENGQLSAYLHDLDWNFTVDPSDVELMRE